MLAAMFGARGIVLSMMDKDPTFRELTFFFGQSDLRVIQICYRKWDYLL